jgi:predicted GIY-YIG superfamily endonuclease
MNYLVFTLLMLMMTGTISTAVAQKQEIKKLQAVKKNNSTKKKIKHTEKRPVPKVRISNPDFMKQV